MTNLKQDFVPRVEVIKIGSLCLEASEVAAGLNQQMKYAMGIGGGSTVTLIDAGQKILVDTGFDYECLATSDNDKRNRRTLVRALRDWGITPDDIDIVFITHWHKDHYGNTDVFRNAVRLASKDLVERAGLKDFDIVVDEQQLAAGVKVILTPGHTIDHASLIIDSRFNGLKTRVAIAGDAILSNSYFQTGRIWSYNADSYNVEAARASILRLLSLSDIIIPGHGTPFMTYRPAWARNDSAASKRRGVLPPT